MNLVSISSNAANVLRGVAGIKYAYAWPTNSIVDTPAVVIGKAVRGQIIPGDRQVTSYELPIRLYVEETLADRARDAVTEYGYVDTFITSIASNSSLSGTVQHCHISAFDTDQYDVVSGSLYSVVEMTLTVNLHEHVVQSL